MVVNSERIESFGELCIAIWRGILNGIILPSIYMVVYLFGLPIIMGQMARFMDIKTLFLLIVPVAIIYVLMARPILRYIQNVIDN
jgi:hypothetical protein